jgi:hypothetical protein
VEADTEMYPGNAKLAPWLGLLVATLLVLVAGACGGGGGSGGGQQEGPKAHAIPKSGKALSPGEYATKVFEPGFSFRVAEGWVSLTTEKPDAVVLGEANGPTLIGFLNVEKVFDPNEPKGELRSAPEDMVAWLQEHPRLDAEEPSRVSVGGISGQQFDAIASAPTKSPTFCAEPCVPLFAIRTDTFWVGKSEKYRFIVLGDVEGQEVTIFFGGPAVEFDESLPKAQKVLDTVEWKGA